MNEDTTDVVDTTEKTIPYERFNQVNQKLKQALEQVEQLKAVATERDELKKQLETQNQEYTSFKSQVAERDELAKLGITDPDGAAVVSLFYGRTDKKISQTDWIESLRKDPEAIPFVLRPILAREEPADKSDKDKKERKPAPPNPKTSGKTAGTVNPFKSIADLEAYTKQLQERS